MKTKLVYVLTCAPEATYIEQALMSVWSARHWNPDAHIVLITDNLTDNLLVGKRGEILNYISEKIVVPFEDDSLSMTYRSRWLKTSVRQLIDGDLLFIDCDTICCRSLAEVDAFNCLMGAVPESMLPIKSFEVSLYHHAEKRCNLLGFSLAQEEYYWCSGVLYIKDVPQTKALCELWFQYWKSGYSLGMFADQPPLAKANIECNHLIQRIPDSFDNILFTQNSKMSEAHILHISSYGNTSFIFSEKVLYYIKDNGVNHNWVQKLLINPLLTFLPFNYEILHAGMSDIISYYKRVVESERIYGSNIDPSFESFPMPSSFRGVVVKLYQKGCYRLATLIWLMWKSFSVRGNKNHIHENICSNIKDNLL